MTYSCYRSYLTFTVFAEDQLLERLFTIARTGASQIDGDSYEKLVMDFHENRNHPEYKNISQHLAHIKSINNLSSPIYTIQFNEKGKGFNYGIISSDTLIFGRAYEKFTERIKTDLQSGGKIKCYYTPNGVYASAFAPITNSNEEVVGVLQIDQTFESFQKSANDMLIKEIMTSTLILIVIAIAIYFLVDYTSRKTRQYENELIGANRELEKEIEARRKAEDELKKKSAKKVEESQKSLNIIQDRFDKVFENSHDGIFIVSTVHNKIVDANPAACRLLQYSKEELTRKLISDVHPFEMDKLMNFALSVEEKGAGWTDELTCLNKSGTFVPAEISASNLEVDGEKYMMAIVRDISERKKVEQELLKANEKLEARVVERTNDLTNANRKLLRTLKKLKQANSELDHFLYKVTHDFRAPLLSIIGLVNLCKVDDSLSQEQIMNYLNLIEQCVKRLDGLNTDITNLMKNQRSAVKKEEIDFKQIIQDEINDLVVLSQDKNILWKVDVDDKEFTGDASRIKMIFRNLISNAAKYTRSNDEESPIEITVATNNEICEITIKDHGIGISEDNLKKIFDMFYRGTEHSKGSGLGLYIVKETVDKLKGKISVKSELKQGTTFVVNLPNSKKKIAESEISSLEESVVRS